MPKPINRAKQYYPGILNVRVAKLEVIQQIRNPVTLCRQLLHFIGLDHDVVSFYVIENNLDRANVQLPSDFWQAQLATCRVIAKCAHYGDFEAYIMPNGKVRLLPVGHTPSIEDERF